MPKTYKQTLKCKTEKEGKDLLYSVSGLQVSRYVIFFQITTWSCSRRYMKEVETDPYLLFGADLYI